MIRIATLEDFNVIKSLIPGLIRDSVYGVFFKNYELTHTMYDPYIEDPLNKFCVVSEEDGKVVGFSMFERFPWKLAETEISLTKMTYYFIEPEYRGRGIMNKFTHCFETWSKSIGAQFSTLNKKKNGYKKAEVIYMKEIN